MPTRVLSTDEAKQSIQRMQSIIDGGLTDQLTALDTEGRQLSDPNIWDGQLANEFRAGIWPETKTALDRMKEQLIELRSKIDAINLNIMQAGGNS